MNVLFLCFSQTKKPSHETLDLYIGGTPTFGISTQPTQHTSLIALHIIYVGCIIIIVYKIFKHDFRALNILCVTEVVRKYCRVISIIRILSIIFRLRTVHVWACMHARPIYMQKLSLQPPMLSLLRKHVKGYLDIHE